MKQILVTDANSPLGQDVVLELLKKDYKVVAATYDTFDASDENAVLSAFESIDFDVVVNTFEYADIEQAQNDEKTAHLFNAIGAKNIAYACRNKDIPLIHISTDFVYDNLKSGFHKENEILNTNCVYGKTKLFGERFIEQSGCKFITLRTGRLFSKSGNNFVKSIRDLILNHNEIKVVSDDLSNPTPTSALAFDIANLTKLLIDDSNFDKYGTYNYGGQDPISQFEFAKFIYQRCIQLGIANQDINVIPVTQKETDNKAMVPKDLAMSTLKFESTFNKKMPRWVDFIDETLKGE